MDRLDHLFKAYLDNRITPDEFAQMWQLLKEAETGGMLEKLNPTLKELWEQHEGFILPAHHWDTRFRALKEEQETIGEREAAKTRRSRKMRILRYGVAAAVILALAGAGYFGLFSRSHDTTVPVIAAMPHDVKPGTTGAILSFENGHTHLLDTLQNGRLTDAVIKTGQEIVISSAATIQYATAPVQYATLTTPRARQQQLTLPDGSKVWLNAASSIRFPSAFTGSKREVELNGEAYFEVAKDAAHPFIVKSNESSIEVLGTHFNVMAYANEKNVRTTLIEGSVRFHNREKSVVLKQGEQSSLNTQGNIIVVPDADIELATAWKNGQQTFRQADIATLMRQVERWYDVDVVFETKLPADMTFTGEGISRNVNLSELLSVFENKQVRFEIDGINKKVIVKRP